MGRVTRSTVSFALGVGLFAVLVIVTSGGAHAATFTVNRTDDLSDAVASGACDVDTGTDGDLDVKTNLVIVVWAPAPTITRRARPTRTAQLTGCSP